MTAPSVSICLPNLNTASFLRERFDTILAQTMTDWECIVCDNESDDGSWEIIREYASREPRIRCSQKPRDPMGMYPNWNNCLREATGEFIYIATSDDTMTADCLEKMVAALDAHPECGLCQCALSYIGEAGEPLELDWFERPLGRFARDWLDRAHIRPAPLDGLLHFGLHNPYTSITQLLIRKSVFDQVGEFDGTWGSEGDFEWEMRASLLHGCIYIPEVLATWRVRDGQATKNRVTLQKRLNKVEMCERAWQRAISIRPELDREYDWRDWACFYLEEVFKLRMKEKASPVARAFFLLFGVLRACPGAWKYLQLKLLREHWEEEKFKRLRKLLGEQRVPEPRFL